MSTALYRYFEPVSNLPNPKGPLSLRVTGIKEANEAVRAVDNAKKRGHYAKIPPEQQAKIAQYAIQHGNPSFF